MSTILRGPPPDLFGNRVDVTQFGTRQAERVNSQSQNLAVVKSSSRFRFAVDLVMLVSSILLVVLASLNANMGSKTGVMKKDKDGNPVKTSSMLGMDVVKAKRTNYVLAILGSVGVGVTGMNLLRGRRSSGASNVMNNVFAVFISVGIILSGTLTFGIRENMAISDEAERKRASRTKGAAVSFMILASFALVLTSIKMSKLIPDDALLPWRYHLVKK